MCAGWAGSSDTVFQCLQFFPEDAEEKGRGGYSREIRCQRGHPRVAGDAARVANSNVQKGKGKAPAGKARSAIKEGKSCRIMYHFADDLPFYTVRGLEARALRLLGHKDFKDLKNGKHFTGDDFSDEESTEEDRSAPDEDAQKGLADESMS